MAGYATRQSTYTTGDVIAEADSNDEFNQLLAAFNASTGHTHDGTAGDGGPISILRDSNAYNRILLDTSNNHLEFYVNVSSSSVQQLRIEDGAIVPITDNDIDLGTASLEFKNLYIDGTANIDSLVADTADINAGTVDAVIGGTTPAAGTFTTLTANTSLALASGATVTAILDEDTMSSDSATALATQQSIKAYVDTQIAAVPVGDITAVNAGTGLSGGGTTGDVTLSIDTGTTVDLSTAQILTNKTLTAPVISTISNTGTLTLPTSTDTLVGKATTDILTNKTLTSPVLNGTLSGTAFLDEDTMSSDSATAVASQQSIKAYVDTTVAATNEVVEDTTPQLGGDLDLNSNDITGTGDINITGTITSSGNITGTLATAAQPNITSVGTLSALTVAGTPTFDGLTVDGDASISSANTRLRLFETDTTDLNTQFQNQAGDFFIKTIPDDASSSTSRFGIDHSTGDISFYDDTGTSQALFWDASAESLGIGTTSPNTPAGNKSLHIAGTTGAELILERDDSGVAADDFIGGLAFLNSDGSNTPPHYLGITARATNEFGASQLEFFSSFEQYPSGTPDMVLDSSGRVGIGTSSPNFKIDNTTTADIGNNTEYTTTRYAFGRAATPCYITAFRESFSSTSSIVFHSNSNEGTSPTEKMRITSSGNVGIGTDSPSRKVHIDGGSTDAAIQFTNTNTGSTGSDGTYIGHAGAGTDFQLFNYETCYMRFGTTGLERMRIDSSGRLLVGKTSTSFNTAGVEAAEDINGDNWALWAISDHSDTLNGTVALNRNSYDGDILRFHKDSSSVGSIGTSSGYTKITSGDGTNGSGLQFGDSKIYPVEANSVVTDNSVDFGDPSYRFKDLYLSGGAYLGGTAAANHLDDYEEGTWTPASGTTGITIQGTPSGTYTKIGRMVYYTISLKCNKTGSGSAQVVFTGLPFSGSGGILQFTRFEPTGISYQWINGSVGGTAVYFTRPGGTAPGTSGGTINNEGPVLQVDHIR